MKSFFLDHPQLVIVLCAIGFTIICVGLFYR